MTWQATIVAERAAGFHEGHQLAFVVGGAARDDALPVRRVHNTRNEGIAVPKLDRIGRLHVIVAVEEDMRDVARTRLGVADDSRVPGGRANRRFESEACQLSR